MWAVIGCAAIIGLLYILTSYAASVFYGPERMGSDFVGLEDGNPWNFLGREVWGPLWILVLLAVFNSSIASSNAITLAGSRMWYAMGRIRLFPPVLGKTHPKFDSPYIAVFALLVPGLALSLWAGEHYTPYMAFAVLATIYTIIMILIYMTVCLACIVFFRREARDEFSVLRHVLMPGAGILALLPAFATALGVGSSFLPFVSPLAPPLDVAGKVVAAVVVVAVAYLTFVHFKHPERILDTAKAFAEEPVDVIEAATQADQPLPLERESDEVDRAPAG